MAAALVVHAGFFSASSMDGLGPTVGSPRSINWVKQQQQHLLSLICIVPIWISHLVYSQTTSDTRKAHRVFIYEKSGVAGFGHGFTHHVSPSFSTQLFLPELS